MLVGPAHVGPRQQPREDDDERAEEDADTQARYDQRAHLLFAKGDQGDESEVDHDDGERQRDRDAAAGGGKGGERRVHAVRPRDPRSGGVYRHSFAMRAASM